MRFIGGRNRKARRADRIRAALDGATEESPFELEEKAPTGVERREVISGLRADAMSMQQHAHLVSHVRLLAKEKFALEEESRILHSEYNDLDKRYHERSAQASLHDEVREGLDRLAAAVAERDEVVAEQKRTIDAAADQIAALVAQRGESRSEDIAALVAERDGYRARVRELEDERFQERLGHRLDDPLDTAALVAERDAYRARVCELEEDRWPNLPAEIDAAFAGRRQAEEALKECRERWPSETVAERDELREEVERAWDAYHMVSENCELVIVQRNEQADRIRDLEEHLADARKMFVERIRDLQLAGSGAMGQVADMRRERDEAREELAHALRNATDLVPEAARDAVRAAEEETDRLRRESAEIGSALVLLDGAVAGALERVTLARDYQLAHLAEMLSTTFNSLDKVQRSIRDTEAVGELLKRHDPLNRRYGQIVQEGEPSMDRGHRRWQRRHAPSSTEGLDVFEPNEAERVPAEMLPPTGWVDSVAREALEVHEQGKQEREVEQQVREANTLAATPWVECDECGQVGTHLGTCSHSAMNDPNHPMHTRWRESHVVDE